METVQEEPSEIIGEKWPFLALVLGLMILLGYQLSTMEREVIQNQWADRRCEIPIMMAASFFKPSSDPRTSYEFAKDNFDFCMKTMVERFMEWVMSPIMAVFSKQVDATGNALQGVDSLRAIAKTMYDQFVSYLEVYFKKFNASVFEMSRIVQHMRMAMQKLNAIALSTLFSGISLFRSMLNAIQLVIKVVLIICAIMAAIIIILWFILFPLIPLIIAALVMIIDSIAPFQGILSPGLQSDAEDKKGVFCFAQGTRVAILDKEGKLSSCAVEDVAVGQRLAHDAGWVTDVFRMEGEGIPLSSVEGILVSDSHLIRGTDGVWKSVQKDERAVRTSRTSSRLYCFNTTSNLIPVLTDRQGYLMFRDWEEIGNEDHEGQRQWNEMVERMLYHHQPGQPENPVSEACETPLMGRNVLVKTVRGWLPISCIQTEAVLDSYGAPQRVRGWVQGQVTDAEDSTGTWHTAQYTQYDGIWKRSSNTVRKGTQTILGWNLITETGAFIIWDEENQCEVCIRDVTEVGHHRIHETYSWVEARLRISE